MPHDEDVPVAALLKNSFAACHARSALYEHSERAAGQYLAALATAGRFEALEDRCRKQLEASAANVHHRYFLAVALASTGRVDEALDHLQTLLATRSEHDKARRLAYRLLVRAARARVQTEAWNDLASTIAEALKFAPPGTDPDRDLAPFRNVLPIAHLRSGNRQQAAELWEQRLLDPPMDPSALHSLALLHYWWARHVADEQGPSASVEQWRGAIAYWVVLMRTDAYWSSWAAAKSKTWGFAFREADIESVRNALVDERLIHYFQAQSDLHAQKGDEAKARVFEDCLTATVLEIKSTAAWREVLPIVPEDPARSPLLALPVGYLFAERKGLLKPIAAIVAKLANDKRYGEIVARIEVYFSDAGIGTAMVLAEERNRSDEALLLIDSIPRGARGRAASYVQAVARARKGASLYGQGRGEEALHEWRTAHQLLQAPDWGHFMPLIEELRRSVSEQAVAGARKEASRLRDANAIDKAIGLLNGARTMDPDGALLELLCVYICDKAREHMNRAVAANKASKPNEARSAYAAARDELGKVSNLKSDYARARQMLSTVYNNEGCMESDDDRSIVLFEKSFDLNPDNYMARENLASALRSKALSIYNPLPVHQLRSGCDPVIKLLERAVKLYASELRADALPKLEALAASDTSAAKNWVKGVSNETLVQLLSDLAVVYGSRAQARGF
jgi:tetratricopeptide (TPR) repeat protein